jgi:hypothetical protein
MHKAPEEPRTWDRHADEGEQPDDAANPMEKLRQEVRRRSELVRLHRSLSRDYPDRT